MEDTLRPSHWDSYIGQHRVKEELDLAIAGALAQERPLGHVLLATTTPGMGKTSLAALIAAKLGDPFDALSVSGLRPAGLSTFFRYYPGGVVLFDELHNANRAMQEQLLTVMEEGYMTSPGGVRIGVNWLTVIGATTEREKLIPALRDRFHIQPRFVPYTEEEMGRIVQSMGAALNVALADDVAMALGRAAGGVPRNARRLVMKARDLSLRAAPVAAAEVLRIAGVDEDGLTDDHRAYLEVLDRCNGTAGLDTLQAMLAVPKVELREMERFLLERGLIARGGQGRELTSAGTRRVRPNLSRPVRRSA